MQACVFGIEYFQVYLTGTHFYLYTDYKLIEKLSSVHKITLNRLQQMMMENAITIRYKPGKDKTKLTKQLEDKVKVDNGILYYL